MPDTATEIDEHPIIFNEWSINRILAGEKTQTRRIVKPQPPKEYNALGGPPLYYDGSGHKYLKYGPGWYFERQTAVDESKLYQVGGSSGCPYGQPGDVLWVREAFRLPAVNDEISPSEYVGAGCDVWRYESTDAVYDPGGWCAEHDYEWGRLRPSIHMPRELCRLRLRVEDVRVERVQEISQSDALAEGIRGDYIHGEEDRRYTDEPHVLGPKYGGSAIHEFSRLWNKIHGDGAWDDNPRVWVIEFSRIESE